MTGHHLVSPGLGQKWPGLKQKGKMKKLRKKYKDVITLCKRMNLSPEDAIILVKAEMIKGKLLALHNARLIELGPLPDWKKVKEERKKLQASSLTTAEG